jgi:hypothetical protein
MRRADLDQVVHDELRRLPSPAAPPTLLPRVLAAVQEWTMRPWYERAWFTWPLGWQVISLAALVGLAGAGVVIFPSAEHALATAIAARTAVVAAALGSVLGHAEAAITAGRIVWRALGEPLVPYAFGVVVLMCVACIAFGTALNRVAFERT